MKMAMENWTTKNLQRYFFDIEPDKKKWSSWRNHYYQRRSLQRKERRKKLNGKKNMAKGEKLKYGASRSSNKFCVLIKMLVCM